MKIFKLKHIVVVLIAGLLGSCTATDNLPEAAETAAIENGDFVMDPNMHYLVNGLVTSDKDLIKKSIKDAWNIHYDFPHNKVTISTSPIEFEKYKNSNLELKNTLAENDRAAKENDSKLQVVNTIQRIAIEGATPPAYVAAFEKKSLIYFYGEKVYIASEGTVGRLGFCVVSSNSDLTNVDVRRSTIRKSDGEETEIMASTPENVSQFTHGSTYTNRKVYFDNESSDNKLTKTFYEDKNYSGLSLTVTLGGNGRYNLKNSSTQWKSYK